MKKIQIITLTYNKLEQATKPYIESLYKYTKEDDFDLIIVDNGSTDGTREFLSQIQKEKSNIKLIFNEENLGFSKGNNIGLKQIDETIPYIGLFNNDILFTPNWLENSVSELDKNPDVGIASPRINKNKKEGFTSENYLKKYTKFLQKFKTTFSEGINAYFCCAILRTETFKNIGLMDEAFTPAFWEDNDYLFRTLYAGYRVGYINTAFIMHNHGTTSKSVDWKDGYKRNEEYFFKKHPLAKYIWAHRRTNIINDIKKYIMEKYE